MNRRGEYPPPGPPFVRPGFAPPFVPEQPTASIPPPPLPQQQEPIHATSGAVRPFATPGLAPPPSLAGAAPPAASRNNPWSAPPPTYPPAAQNQWNIPPPPPSSGAPNQWNTPPPPPPPPTSGGGPIPTNQLFTGRFRPPPPPTSQVSNLVDQFKSLQFGSAPGSADTTSLTLLRPSLEDPLAPVFDEEISESSNGRYFKFTTHAMPNAHSLAARWHLPLGAVIHPLAEAPPGEEVPVVGFGPSGIVRCRRCRTYINPFNEFVDNGTYFRCCICGLLNQVPEDYYSPVGVDAQGKRCDAMERPELYSGSADYVAPAEYMVRPPMPPSYFFLIDVSSATAKSGMLQVVADTIKSCLDKLPGYPRTQVGFLTFDSSLHFYNLKSSLSQPHMVVLGELEEPFLPLPVDDLLVNLSESRTVVEALLDRLPTMFANNDNVESALGSALQATVSVMGEIGGKVLLFQSTLPSLGTGALKLRGQDPRVYGTDKESTVRVAEHLFYRQIAGECSKTFIGVNVYSFYEKYTDLATLGTISKVTGGQVYYYPGYNTSTDGEQLRYDLTRDLTRETAWEAVMRVRCGRGVKYSVCQGHFMLRSSDLLSLPAVDCDKTFSVLFELSETLLTTKHVYFQVALLYTSSAGERRIRVHTAAVPVVSDLNAMYQAANVDAIMGVMSRLAIERSYNDKLENARQLVQTKMLLSLKEFRHLHSVQNQLAGRFVYPESLRLLPLYALTLCKTLALRGGYLEVPVDLRSAAASEMLVMSLPRLLRLLYPLFIRLDEYLLKQDENSPKALELTSSNMTEDGAFLYFDGLRFILWFGRGLEPEFVDSLVGYSETKQIIVVEKDNKLSKKLRFLISKLRKLVPECYQPCHVVMQGDAAKEIQLFQNLYEDRVAAFPSYDEWMVQTHSDCCKSHVSAIEAASDSPARWKLHLRG